MQHSTTYGVRTTARAHRAIRRQLVTKIDQDEAGLRGGDQRLRIVRLPGKRPEHDPDECLGEAARTQVGARRAECRSALAGLAGDLIELELDGIGVEVVHAEEGLELSHRVDHPRAEDQDHGELADRRQDR